MKLSSLDFKPLKKFLGKEINGISLENYFSLVWNTSRKEEFPTWILQVKYLSPWKLSRWVCSLGFMIIEWKQKAAAFAAMLFWHLCWPGIMVETSMGKRHREIISSLSFRPKEIFTKVAFNEVFFMQVLLPQEPVSAHGLAPLGAGLTAGRFPCQPWWYKAAAWEDGEKGLHLDPRDCVCIPRWSGRKPLPF